MLQELRVQNLALIDSLHLDLSAQQNGLIVLTGETGAGKSIILQAINLLTGGRGTASWVRGDCDQADIQAVFGVRTDHTEMHSLLGEHALTDGDACIVRRVLTREGRSRLYINDRSVTARLAGELTANLVNIASQHDQQQLLNARFHLDYLDLFGDLWPQRQQFGQLYRRWQQAALELRQLREREQDKERQRDFLTFQLAEIHKVGVCAGEDEQLCRERDRLKASDGLLRLVGDSGRILADTVSGRLTEIRKNLEQAATLDSGLVPVAERLAAAGYELEDVADLLSKYVDDIPTDASKLELISARLAELRQLQRKYGPTLEDVLVFASAAEADLARLEDLEAQIGLVEQRVGETAAAALKVAQALTAARREAAGRLAVGMEQELSSLSFPQAVFRVDLRPPAEGDMTSMQASGADVAEFLFSANPGEPVKPLVRIVSGGELSRLMLAMKCLLARRDQVDTVIFDEVDAGIGGQAAEAVANKISELAGHHQVFCITHLPQIAACADLHFRVEKLVEGGRTRTVIKPLDREQQVAELARMLGGAHPTPQTEAYARELFARKSGRKTA
ncbi:MAG: DNA repair protein RecN [Desulfobulbus sp.]|jgi:DNA repair protein RecN (Recombination protein N)|nr:DNA repair protein RecN [Desulfobulbus sp.]